MRKMLLAVWGFTIRLWTRGCLKGFLSDVRYSLWEIKLSYR